MDGIETPQDTPVQGRSLVEKDIVETKERDSVEQLPCPRCSGLSMRSDRANDLHPRKRTRCAIGTFGQMVDQRVGLRLADYELDQGGRVEIDGRLNAHRHGPLQAPRPEAARPSPASTASQLERVAARQRHSPACRQLLKALGAGHRHQPRYGFASVGHLDRLPALHLAQILARLLSQLPDSDHTHVLHIAQTYPTLAVRFRGLPRSRRCRATLRCCRRTSPPPWTTAAPITWPGWRCRRWSCPPPRAGRQTCRRSPPRERSPTSTRGPGPQAKPLRRAGTTYPGRGDARRRAAHTATASPSSTGSAPPSSGSAPRPRPNSGSSPEREHIPFALLSDHRSPPRGGVAAADLRGGGHNALQAADPRRRSRKDRQGLLPRLPARPRRRRGTAWLAARSTPLGPGGRLMEAVGFEPTCAVVVRRCLQA